MTTRSSLRRTARHAGAAALLLGAGCGGAGEGASESTRHGTQRPTGDAEIPVQDAPLDRPQPGNRTSAQRLHAEAMAALAEDDVAAAHVLFEAAVAADPTCVAPRIEHGYLLLEAGERGSHGRALLHFRLAGLLAPGEPMAACGEGLVRVELGDLERAEPLLRAALADPAVQAHRGRATLARGSLGRIAAMRGEGEAALAAFRTVHSTAGIPAATRAHYLLLEAELHLEAARAAEAAACVDAAIGLEPENVRAHHLRAQLLARDGDAAGAARERRIHELLRALADHESRRFELDRARRHALRRELVAAWPEHRDGALELVRLLVEDGEFAAARAEATAHAAGREADPRFTALRARACAGAGDLEAAARHLTGLRFAAAGARNRFLRQLLEDWQRGDPARTPAQAAAHYAAWGGT